MLSALRHCQVERPCAGLGGQSAIVAPAPRGWLTGVLWGEIGAFVDGPDLMRLASVDRASRAGAGLGLTSLSLTIRQAIVCLSRRGALPHMMSLTVSGATNADLPRLLDRLTAFWAVFEPDTRQALRKGFRLTLQTNSARQVDCSLAVQAQLDALPVACLVLRGFHFNQVHSALMTLRSVDIALTTFNPSSERPWATDIGLVARFPALTALTVAVQGLDVTSAWELARHPRLKTLRCQAGHLSGSHSTLLTLLHSRSITHLAVRPCPSLDDALAQRVADNVTLRALSIGNLPPGSATILARNTTLTSLSVGTCSDFSALLGMPGLRHLCLGALPDITWPVPSGLLTQRDVALITGKPWRSLCLHTIAAQARDWQSVVAADINRLYLNDAGSFAALGMPDVVNNPSLSHFSYFRQNTPPLIDDVLALVTQCHLSSAAFAVRAIEQERIRAEWLRRGRPGCDLSFHREQACARTDPGCDWLATQGDARSA